MPKNTNAPADTDETMTAPEEPSIKKAPEEPAKMMKICLPLTRELKDDVFVGINGKSYLIKRGEEVTVPESVAHVLKNREKMLMIAMEVEAAAAKPIEAMEAMK